MRFGYLFLAILFSCGVFAQKEANVWFFGYRAGLDFNSGSPLPLAGGQINALEGCATICDTDGGLLFYTDGSSIWNRNHIVMPNGGGLTGQSGQPTNSTSQAAIIVPVPQKSGLYYVFSLSSSTGGADIPGVLYYGVVDMSLDGGLGDVVAGRKRVQLDTGLVEYLTAVRHSNKSDVWVVVRDNEDNYISFLANTHNVGGRISSSIGQITRHNPYALGGCMTASPNGKKLAVAVPEVGFGLLDFDNATGVVSNPVLLGQDLPRCYGVSFSPNGQFLYGTVRDSNIYQWNTRAGSPSAIQASVSKVGTLRGFIGQPGTLQLGPDGKIYMARHNATRLCVINKPNVSGAGCDFQQDAVSLSPGAGSTFGLPNYVQTYFLSPRPRVIQYWDTCFGMDTKFSFSPGFAYADSLRWYFGDGLSGALNTSTLDSPGHRYVTGGVFTVMLISYVDGVADTIRTTVTIDPALTPVVRLGNDTDVCGDYFELKSQLQYNSPVSYLWNTGETTVQIHATQSGAYWLEVSRHGCSAADTISIGITNNPAVDLGPDTAICDSDPALILQTRQPQPPGAQYLWSTGSSADHIEVSETGRYWLTVAVGKCRGADTVDVTVVPNLTISIGNDTAICLNQSVVIGTDTEGVTYRWNTGDETRHIKVSNPGDYILTVRRGPCVARDTMHVSLLPFPVVDIGPDTAICPGDPDIVLANRSVHAGSYSNLWSNGATSSAIAVSESGTYWLTVSDEHGCTTTDSIDVRKGCYLAIPNVFTPDGDGVNDYFFPRALLSRNVTAFSMQVFSRWGQLVYETNSIDGRGWDGTLNGIKQSPGVYVYLIEVSFANNIHEKYKGNVTLLR